MSNLDDVQAAFSDAQVNRWDREWLIYLNTEDPGPHLVKARTLLPAVASIAGKSRREVFYSSLTTLNGVPQPVIRIWADGDWLVGRSVIEFGCGTGFVGKNLGHLVEKFLGVDVSDLAIAISNSGKHHNTQFVQISDLVEMKDHLGAYDTWVAREFFIHQNFNMARETLLRGLPFLKPGGRICADFYEPNYKIEQGVLHPAKAPLNAQYASCGYFFAEQEIMELAREVGVSVDEQTIDLTEQRRFVVFRK